VLALRSGGRLTLVAFYYLNIGAADAAQLAALSGNFSRLVQLLQRETGYEINLVLLNHYYYFWRLQLYSGRYKGRAVRKQLSAMALQHRFSRFERVALAVHSHRIRGTRRALRRFRRERFFSRTFRPVVAAFMSEDFDGDLVAKAVALELQILRINHRSFIRYLRSLLWMGFHYWNHHRRLEGLRLTIQGRLTLQRRQGRRTTVTNLRYGDFRRSDLRREASHCRYVAYNRFGAIGVSLSYQQRPVVAEQWEDRVAQSPLRAFGLREMVETLGERRDGRLDPRLRVASPAYQRWPGAVLDCHGVLETAWSPAGSAATGATESFSAMENFSAENFYPTVPNSPSSLNSGVANLPATAEALAAAAAPLEVLNRLGYYRRRLALHQRAADRPFRRPLLLLRPRRSTLAKGYSQSHRFPLRRASLAPFQLSLSRQRALAERRQAGDRRPDRHPSVAPTSRQRKSFRGESSSENFSEARSEGRRPLPQGHHWPKVPAPRRCGAGRRPWHSPATHPSAAALPFGRGAPRRNLSQNPFPATSSGAFLSTRSAHFNPPYSSFSAGFGKVSGAPKARYSRPNDSLNTSSPW